MSAHWNLKSVVALVIVLSLAWLVIAQTPMQAQQEEAIPPDHPMWEYEQVSLKDVPDKDELLKLLNERGLDGWELVDVLPRGSFEKAKDNWPTLIFKKGRK
jgi:hypothetical protein